MSSEPLIAHSLAEGHLYVRAIPCTSCGRGPLQASAARSVDTARSALAKGGNGGGGVTVTITATCGACQSVRSLMFELPGSPAGGANVDAEGLAIVNPTDESSRILDVGQWIMLSRMVLEAAGNETDKGRARRLRIEAAQCLEEALKFYDEVDNDLPPREALFNDASRERLRDAPEQFSRRRLVELRSKLPNPPAMRSYPSAPTKKPWWRRPTGD